MILLDTSAWVDSIEQPGVTPRGLIDCMIAAVAQRHDAPVLAFDRDFARLSAQTDVTLHPDSLQ